MGEPTGEGEQLEAEMGADLATVALMEEAWVVGLAAAATGAGWVVDVVGATGAVETTEAAGRAEEKVAEEKVVAMVEGETVGGLGAAEMAVVALVVADLVAAAKAVAKVEDWAGARAEVDLVAEVRGRRTTSR